MSTERLESRSADETAAIGERIGREAKAGEVYALCGDLGAGKTVLAQGVAKGLGISGYVNSPTFTLLQVYEGGRLPLYHFDVYRIEDPEEMREVGLDEYLYGDGLCLIEWAGLIEELLPPDCIRINIERDDDRDFDHRVIRIER
ncbi:MAG: tRNA (adenosine(37)-N6)-threonylcarbamoyltransferase complex ATPase subunit type 1 TsaE [Lachnospiraceae bacterium]|nr:tRNA (adenosine(37)-N6)-threonylcarbamoyltransferase complex ATPase subunit type 1 TsaE [Lachnospiraceae bacterium]